jgi:hypothetical protein
VKGRTRPGVETKATPTRRFTGGWQMRAPPNAGVRWRAFPWPGWRYGDPAAASETRGRGFGP